MYAPNKRTLQYRKQTDRTESEIDKSTIIIEDFNTALSVINRINKHKISKDEELNTIKQLYLTDMCRIPNNSITHILFKCTQNSHYLA